MTILVLNCGSSSIKYQVIRIQSMTEHQLLAKGIVDRIGQEEGVMTHTPNGKDGCAVTRPIVDHSVGIHMIINALIDPQHGVIESLLDLKGVGHRVVHGGEFFHDNVLINKDVVKKIEACVELAPIHNPANLKGIEAISMLIPNIPQVAVFDTSFHQSVPKKNYLYALPYEYYEKYRVRKYGFHGTSHRYVAEKACALTGVDHGNSKIITCHIGNGASVTAILNGKSYDTSMGFTPVDGLIMGTRCGEVDPTALFYIAQKEDMTISRIDDMINKQSGMVGLTGMSDMRDVDAAVERGDEHAEIAREMYDERVTKYIGAYAAKMGGVDLIVFTGGVGENSPEFRQVVCRGLGFMGVEFDEAANYGVLRQDKIISKPESRVKVAMISTNEELVIATDTFRLLKKRSE